MKVKKRLLLNLLLPITLALALINLYTLKIVNERHREIANEKINILNVSLQQIALDPLWKYDIDVLKDAVDTFGKREEISKLIVFSDRDEILARYVSKSGHEKVYETFQLPMVKLGNYIGYIQVEYSDKIIAQTSSKLKRDLYNIQIVFILIFIIIISIYSRSIHRALQKIIWGINELLNENLDFKLILNREDEFLIIEKNFNDLTNKLKEDKTKAKRSIEEFNNTKEELEAAYNQMISINGVLETTLSNLELSEGKYKNIFKYSPFGIVLYNIEGNHIIECNNELLRIFDVETEYNLEDFFEKEGISRIIKSLYHSRDIEDEELYLSLVNKTVIVSVIPFKNEDKYIQVFFKDITEIKNLQIKLQNYAKDLEREVALQTRDLKEASDKIKNQQQRLVEDAYNKGLVEVTSGIIHNIGNIVNVISLNLDELKQAFESNEQVLPRFFEDVLLGELDKLNNLNPKLQRALEVMPDLLKVYKEFDIATNNKVEYLYKKVDHLKEIVQLQQNFVGSLGTEDYNDINHVIDEVLEIYESSLIKRGIRINKEYTGDSALLCDKAQMIQLFSNFIKNSYEAIEEADKNDGHINIKTKIKNDYLNIIIEDNGIGIREESKNRLFEFGYSTKKHMGIGSGFGLHSCKNVVEKYGGTIEYLSEFGKYTKFIINFPIARKEAG